MEANITYFGVCLFKFPASIHIYTREVALQYTGYIGLV